MPYTGQPGVDWGSVAQMLNLERQITEAQQQQKVQAMQWQGQQDYQTLVNSGVEPREALKRTAPKLFYSDPRGMANAIVASQSMYGPTSEPVTKTLKDGTTLLWTGNSWQPIKPTTLGSEAYTTITTTDPVTKEKQTRKVLTSDLEAQKKQAATESATAQYQAASQALGGVGAGLFGIGRTKQLEALGQAEQTLQKGGIDIPAAAAYAARFRSGQGGSVPAPAPTIPAAPIKKENRQLNQLYTLPDGRKAVWKEGGWEIVGEDLSKFSTMSPDIQYSNAGTRG